MIDTEENIKRLYPIIRSSISSDKALTLLHIAGQVLGIAPFSFRPVVAQGSADEERLFLSSFLKKSARGEILVVSEIKKAYEKAVGHRVPKSTIYRIVARHGWRKIAPRPRHPKGDAVLQEEFKKNSPK